MCSSVAPGQEGMSAEIKICSRRLFSWFLVDKVSKCKQYFDTSQTDTGIIRSISGKACIGKSSMKDDSLLLMVNN